MSKRVLSALMPLRLLRIQDHCFKYHVFKIRNLIPNQVPIDFFSCRDTFFGANFRVSRTSFLNLWHFYRDSAENRFLLLLLLFLLVSYFFFIFATFFFLSRRRFGDWPQFEWLPQRFCFGPREGHTLTQISHCNTGSGKSWKKYSKVFQSIFYLNIPGSPLHNFPVVASLLLEHWIPLPTLATKS